MDRYPAYGLLIILVLPLAESGASDCLNCDGLSEEFFENWNASCVLFAAAKYFRSIAPLFLFRDYFLPSNTNSADVADRSVMTFFESL